MGVWGVPGVTMLPNPCAAVAHVISPSIHAVECKMGGVASGWGLVLGRRCAGVATQQDAVRTGNCARVMC